MNFYRFLGLDYTKSSKYSIRFSTNTPIFAEYKKSVWIIYSFLNQPCSQPVSLTVCGLLA